MSTQFEFLELIETTETVYLLRLIVELTEEGGERLTAKTAVMVVRKRVVVTRLQLGFRIMVKNSPAS